jgi:site-specific recombinase XerD
MEFVDEIEGVKFVNDSKAYLFSADDIEEFIFFCKKGGNNTERIKRRFSVISAFYKYLRKKKVVKDVYTSNLVLYPNPTQHYFSVKNDANISSVSLIVNS